MEVFITHNVSLSARLGLAADHRVQPLNSRNLHCTEGAGGGLISQNIMKAKRSRGGNGDEMQFPGRACNVHES